MNHDIRMLSMSIKSHINHDNTQRNDKKNSITLDHDVKRRPFEKHAEYHGSGHVNRTTLPHPVALIHDIK